MYVFKLTGCVIKLSDDSAIKLKVRILKQIHKTKLERAVVKLTSE